MRLPLIVAALGLTAPLPAMAQVSAPAAAATADPAAASFIDRLSGDAFAILRDKSLPRDAARTKFRAMLQDNVALTEIGNRLIRRQRASLTPAQYQAYLAALPEFILNAYATRLYDYADAKVTILRTTPRGTSTDVVTRVAKPGAQAIEAIWQVRKGDDGHYRINGLSVAGINLTLTQEADFSAYIQKNGFDALVAFMKSANAKSLRTAS